MNPCIVLSSALLLAVFTGCATPSSEPTDHARQESKWDLSPDAFIEEMLYPQGMARTPRFDDYTAGSYHVRKVPLVERVRTANTNELRRIEAVLVLGPAGPLWQYNVITIVSTNPASDNVRINHLVFPHARITYKSSRLLPRREMVGLLDKLMAHPSLRDIRNEDHAEDAEWNLSAIVSAFGASPMTRVLPKSVMTNEAPDIEGFYETVNDLLGGESATTTYSTTPED